MPAKPLVLPVCPAVDLLLPDPAPTTLFTRHLPPAPLNEDDRLSADVRLADYKRLLGLIAEALAQLDDHLRYHEMEFEAANRMHARVARYYLADLALVVECLRRAISPENSAVPRGEWRDVPVIGGRP